MRVHNYWLRFGVAYYANAEVARHLVEVVGELCPEVGVLDAVDVTVEFTAFFDCTDTSTLCSHVGMIVCSVEKVCYTGFSRNDSK